MTLIPDASSVYQGSLPVSSDNLIKLLDQWGIIYDRSNHAPLKTVEDAKKNTMSVFIFERRWRSH